MRVSLLDRRALFNAFFLCVTLSITLALGFIPTSLTLIRFLPFSHRLGQYLGFPILAALFYFSLPKRKIVLEPDLSFLLKISALPILIAFICGRLLPHPIPNDPWALAWYVVLAPVGEELLFRGWVFNLFDRLWPNTMVTATNPLSVAVWASTLGFSIWHLQNFGTAPAPVVFFQIAYTFIAGLWLGYLRWKSGHLLLPILGHIAINSVF